MKAAPNSSEQARGSFLCHRRLVSYGTGIIARARTARRIPKIRAAVRGYAGMAADRTRPVFGRLLSIRPRPIASGRRSLPPGANHESFRTPHEPTNEDFGRKL